jgi:hypothetical protein
MTWDYIMQHTFIFSYINQSTNVNDFGTETTSSESADIQNSEINKMLTLYV